MLSMLLILLTWHSNWNKKILADVASWRMGIIILSFFYVLISYVIWELQNKLFVDVKKNGFLIYL